MCRSRTAPYVKKRIPNPQKGEAYSQTASYVGHPPCRITERELEAMFGEFGSVAMIKIVKHRHAGQSKGFGFVEMPSDLEADRPSKS